MANPEIPTSPDLDLHAQVKLLESVPLLTRVLDSIPAMLMVLNRDRQVVFANHRLVRFAGAADAEELRGLRPGVLYGCIHATEEPNGCGFAESCTVCGSLRASQMSYIGRAATEHARLVRGPEGAEETLELEVSASPIEVSGQPFTLVHISDVSDRMRRHWFERTLVPHALALSTELEVLAASTANPEAGAELRSGSAVKLQGASRRLGTLLREMSAMADAEAGGYACARVNIPADELLATVASEGVRLEAAIQRNIVMEPCEGNPRVDTDPVMLRRVLDKMLANALEATPPGGTVTLGCRARGTDIELWMRNPGSLPQRTRLQIFQRGFSTKGPGRGYGTYFIKLMTERCLGGSAAFRSSPEEGTTFSVRLPAAPAVEPSR